MPRGPKVKKWIYLLDNVEAIGYPYPDPEYGFSGDSFQLWVNYASQNSTSNYRHLAVYLRGSHGYIQCETYVDGPTNNRAMINRVEPWPIPPHQGQKPIGEPFSVVDPNTGIRRNLRTGDKVRLKGRWVVEHHHWRDEYFTADGPAFVGYNFVEFHPFDWHNIELVVAPPPTGTWVETVSVAAPLFETVMPDTYPELQLYIAPDGDPRGKQFHDTVKANAFIPAPTLPAGHPPRADLVRCDERVIVNTTGLPKEQVRDLRVVDDGIHVRATVSVPLTQWAGTVKIPDFNEPACGSGAFQARYSVWWHEIPPYVPPKVLRLSVDPTPTPSNNRPVTVTVRAIDAQSGALVNGTVTVRNPGQPSATFATNTPFDFRFRRGYDPETDTFTYPYGSVKAPGYPARSIPFDFRP